MWGEGARVWDRGNNIERTKTWRVDEKYSLFFLETKRYSEKVTGWNRNDFFKDDWLFTLRTEKDAWILIRFPTQPTHTCVISATTLVC